MNSVISVIIIVVVIIIQGSQASLKVLECFSPKFKALKVLENRAGA